MRWQSYLLKEYINDEIPIKESLPLNIPAIYMYRLRIQCTNTIATNRDDFITWVKDQTNRPVGKINKQPLSSYMQLEGLTIGGKGLTPEKQNSLSRYSNMANRNYLINFLESLSNYSPIIYIGSTSRIQQRTIEHIEGSTTLKEYIENIGYSLEQLELLYYTIESNGNAIPEDYLLLLEMICQSILIPFGTKRLG